jgi:PDZ domain
VTPHAVSRTEDEESWNGAESQFEKEPIMFNPIWRTGTRLPLLAVAAAVGVWIASGSAAFAHGGGGGGGGHGGGGFGGGGFGGGHMGGFGGGFGGFGGGFGGGGFGGGFGRGVGGFGGGFGRGGFGFGNRFAGLGGFGGFGGWGWGGFWPWGLYGGWGYPYGLGYGWGGYGLGGYGYPGFGGYGYGYPGMAYGYGGFPGYGYGMGGMSPYVAGYNMNVAPANGFGYTSAYVPPAGGAATNGAAPQRRVLGIDEEPVVSADGRRAMRVANVYPGTAAAKAGLQAGDVLRSINGYMTEQRGNLAWIIANAAPSNELKMIVRTAKDGKDHTITATLP